MGTVTGIGKEGGDRGIVKTFGSNGSKAKAPRQWPRGCVHEVATGTERRRSWQYTTTRQGGENSQRGLFTRRRSRRSGEGWAVTRRCDEKGRRGMYTSRRSL